MVQIYRSMRLLFVEWLHLRRLPVPLIGVVLSMVGSRRLGSRFSVVVSVDDRVGGLVSSGRCFSGGVGVAIAFIEPCPSFDGRFNRLLNTATLIIFS